MSVDPSRIRNFSIVAHIDHGKSTLSDRLIQTTGGLTQREMTAQVLDSMDIERERGITIKAQTVRLDYRAQDGLDYVLNLIDTPGHVDFAYEVSRSLTACEGSILVVDASQGVEAQTLANVYQAIEANHEIVPVLNKVDLPAAEPDRVRAQIEEVIGIDASQAVLASAKTGLGIAEDAGGHRPPACPAPKGDGRPPQGAVGGRLVRPVPGRGGPRPRVRRRHPRRPADPHHGDELLLPRGEGRRLQAAPSAPNGSTPSAAEPLSPSGQGFGAAQTFGSAPWSRATLGPGVRAGERPPVGLAAGPVWTRTG